MNEILTANRWYPAFKGAGRSYKSPYPTPQSILRNSVGVEEYKWICKTVTADHIRGACVLPRGVPYTHLTNTPWSLIYTTPDWVMVIVSVADRSKWIELARASGAIAWQTAHNMTYIYEWTEPSLDSNGMEIRPPNAMGITGVDSSKRSDYNVPKKKYDREALIADIRLELLTYDEVSDKYGLTRQTIYNIIKREGIDQPRRLRKDSGKPKKDYGREALIADIRANQMTYAELGKKYDLKAISVQRIARIEGLSKPRIKKNT